MTGTIKKVEGWTKFSSTDPGEQSGHYFPVVLDDQYRTKPITCEGSKTKTEMDVEWVLRVDNCKKFTFKSGQDIIVTLDFNKASLK